MVEVSRSSRRRPFAGCYHQLLPVVWSRLKRTIGNCTYNCLPWAGLPVLPVSIADVNYLSCKMAFTKQKPNTINRAVDISQCFISLSNSLFNYFSIISISIYFISIFHYLLYIMFYVFIEPVNIVSVVCCTPHILWNKFFCLSILLQLANW